MADTCRRTRAEGLPELQGEEVARADAPANIGHGEALHDMRPLMAGEEADAPLQLPPLQLAVLGCPRKVEANPANKAPKKRLKTKIVSYRGVEMSHKTHYVNYISITCNFELLAFIA